MSKAKVRKQKIFSSLHAVLLNPTLHLFFHQGFPCPHQNTLIRVKTRVSFFYMTFCDCPFCLDYVDLMSDHRNLLLRQYPTLTSTSLPPIPNATVSWSFGSPLYNFPVSCQYLSQCPPMNASVLLSCSVPLVFFLQLQQEQTLPFHIVSGTGVRQLSSIHPQPPIIGHSANPYFLIG